jgi:hypothetical protein
MGFSENLEPPASWQNVMSGMLVHFHQVSGP